MAKIRSITTLLLCLLSSIALAQRPSLEARMAQRDRAFSRLLDLTFKTKVRLRRPSKRNGFVLAEGFSGVVRLLDGRRGKRIRKTVSRTFDMLDLGPPVMAKIFTQEVQIQKAVNRLVPSLAPEVLTRGARPWSFDMRHLAGKDLFAARRSDLNPGAFGRFARKLARVHAAGIAHGDIKPANILVVDGELVLLDWGCARRPLSRGGTRTTMDRFMVGEEIRHPKDLEIDLFAFDQKALGRVGAWIAALE